MLGPWLLAPHLKAMIDAAGTALSTPGANVVETSRPPSSSALLSAWAPRLLIAAAAVLVLLSPTARWAAGHPWPEEARVGSMIPYHLAARMSGREPAQRRDGSSVCPTGGATTCSGNCLRATSLFWYSRPEAFMRPQAERAPPLDPSPGEWRALVKRYRFDTLFVCTDSSPGLLAYLAETPPGEWVVVEDNTSADSTGGGPASRGRVVVRREHTSTSDPSNP